MIEYNPKNWLTLIFQFHKSTQMRLLLPNLFIIAAYTSALAYIELEYLGWTIDPKVSIHGLIGIVLGLVLVFRTNTAYDRWWEGRKLWGGLVNHSRNSAIKFNALLDPADKETRDYISRTIGNFAIALKSHLRKETNLNELDYKGLDYENDIERSNHIPNLLVRALQQKLNQLLSQQKITGDQYRVANREFEGMIDVMGGCERIMKTPIPFSYSMWVKKVIFIYLITLPLGLITALHYWAIPATVFVAYTLAGLELIGEEIEDPFGTDTNDLNTEGMALTIKANVIEILN